MTAINASPQMLARFRAKLDAEASARANVEVRLGSIDDLAAELSGPFDGIISSFAALNTVNLSALAPQAARLLRPGGRLISATCCRRATAGPPWRESSAARQTPSLPT